MSNNPPKLPLTRMSWYKKYCLRYRYNFLMFVVEASGKKPTWQQVEMMNSMSVPNFMVSVVSGHGTGKSFTYAWFIIWHVTVFPFSNLILTGPKFEQLRKIIWKELTDALEILHKRFPILKDYFQKDAKSFYYKGFKESWFAEPQTAPRKEPEKLAGQHRDKYTVLVEEASGLPDEHFDTIKGALTGKDNSLALISQGTRPNGEFYDSHHKKRELYHTLRFDSELSPLVSKKWIRDRLKEYGGFFATLYQIRVKGAFPNQLEGRLIARSWAEACGDVQIVHDEIPGILITVDVSGPGHDDTVYLVSKVSGWESKRKVETVELTVKQGVSKIPAVAREVKMLYLKYEHLGPQIGVDHVGVGQGVHDLLEEWGLPVHLMNVGSPPYDDEQYLNKRAEWSWWLRDAVFDCNITFRGISRPTQQLIYDQFGNIPYRIADNGKFKLWSKEQMRTEGIKSPDLYDVYMFAMGLDYTAMDIEKGEDAHFEPARIKANSVMQKVEEQLREAGL
jgi:hypothetical protein